jgi:hypothetical protein
MKHHLGMALLAVFQLWCRLLQMLGLVDAEDYTTMLTQEDMMFRGAVLAALGTSPCQSARVAPRGSCQCLGHCMWETTACRDATLT